MSRMKNPSIIPAIGIALIAYWTLTVLQMPGFADDPGLGWHLLTGEKIRAAGSIPLFDPYLASTEPRPWIADQWLSDFLFASILHRGGPNRGMALIYGFTTSVFLLLFFGIVFCTAFERGRSQLLSAIASLIALKLAATHFIVRPVLLSFVPFAIASAITGRIISKVRGGTVPGLRQLAPLIPLTALWANLHPSFALGIILLAAATTGLVVDTVIIDRRPLAVRTFALLAITICLMVVATLATPFGVGLLRQVFELVGSDFFMNLNNEWRPLNARSPEGTLFYQTVGLLLGGAFFAVRRGAPLYVTECLILGFFGWSAITSVRFLPYFAILAAPPLAQALVCIVGCEPFMRLPIYRRVGDYLSALDAAGRRAVPCYLWAVAAIAAFPIIDAALHGTVYPYQGPFEQSREKFPYDGAAALDDIISREAPPTPVAVAATPDWGGFLAYHGKGRFKPVIDDRNSLLGEEAYKDFLENQRVEGDILGYLKRVRAKYLLLKTNEPLSIYLRDTGKLNERWRGKVSVIFEVVD
jgi:hypothetical protein